MEYFVSTLDIYPVGGHRLKMAASHQTCNRFHDFRSAISYVVIS